MNLPVDQRLGYDIKATEVAFMSAKTELLRGLGLTVSQYAALVALRDNPGISGAGLARTCLVTPQASAATLKVLESKGLAIRGHDEWSRATRPSRLTPEGFEVTRRADDLAVLVEQRMYDALTAEERVVLRGLLARCRAAASRAK